MKKWTEEEITLLKENYPTHTSRELNKLLLNRTKKAIEWKLGYMGIKKEKKIPNLPKVNLSEKLCSLTLINRLKNNPHPPIKKWESKISKELFYIIGVIMGDGCLTMSKARRGYSYIIRLEVTDKSFANKFYKTLKTIGLNPYYYTNKREFKKQSHYVSAQSKSFFLWFKDIDYNWVLDTSTDMSYSFLKGVYESDGSLDISKKGVKARIRNTNGTLLLTIKYILEKLGFHPTFFTMNKNYLKSGKSYYAVNLNRKSEVKEFLEKIKPCIERKTL